MYNLLHNTYSNMTDSIFNFQNQKGIELYKEKAFIDYDEFFKLNKNLRIKAGEALKQLLEMDGETLNSLDFDNWYEGLNSEL